MSVPDLNQELQFFKTRFETSSSPLIVFNPQTASLDQVALATSLYLAFKNRPLLSNSSSLNSHQTSSNTSNSTLASVTPALLNLSDLLVEHSALVGINQATSSLPAEGLVIAIDNSDNSVGNISCDADENSQQLKIYIKSQNNKSIIDADKINFQPLIIEPDLIIGVGLNSLQPLEDHGITSFSPQNTIFLQPNHLEQVYNFDPIQAGLTSSYSEFLAVLFRHWVWTIDQDIATNLLMGIDSATNNFANPNLSPSAFEAAGWLLRQGGQRYLPELALQQTRKPVTPEAVPKFSGLDLTTPSKSDVTPPSFSDFGQLPQSNSSQSSDETFQPSSNPKKTSRRQNYRRPRSKTQRV